MAASEIPSWHLRRTPSATISRPAELGFRVDLGAMIDQKLNYRSLPGNDCPDERRAAAPARVSYTLIDQVVDVCWIVEERVIRVAHHRIIAKVGMRVDVITQFKGELYGFQPIRFRYAGERTGTLALPVVES